MKTMRDAFFYRVFERTKSNPDIVVLTSDFSAPSFDRFRTELPGQFINTGISEQNTMLVAAGLAHSGKKVFVVSIAPFIVMRCYEQTRLYAADMNLDITIVGNGAGFSYNTAGPTHHCVEDIALFRALPNMKIFSAACNSQVESFADWCADNGGPAYVRIDRMTLDEIYGEKFDVNDDGFYVLREGKDVLLLATGYMAHTALKAADSLRSKGIDVGVVDLYRMPAGEDALLQLLKSGKQIVTVEEHIYPGGMGSYICEFLADKACPRPIKRFALDFSKGFYHGYGTRDEMHAACGIGAADIQMFIEGQGYTNGLN